MKQILYTVFVRRCDGFPGEGYSHWTLPENCPDVATALADCIEADQTKGRECYISRFECNGPVERL